MLVHNSFICKKLEAFYYIWQQSTWYRVREQSPNELNWLYFLLSSEWMVSYKYKARSYFPTSMNNKKKFLHLSSWQIEYGLFYAFPQNIERKGYRTFWKLSAIQPEPWPCVNPCLHSPFISYFQFTSLQILSAQWDILSISPLLWMVLRLSFEDLSLRTTFFVSHLCPLLFLCHGDPE